MSYFEALYSFLLILCALGVIFLLKILFKYEKNIIKQKFKIRFGFLVFITLVLLSSHFWLHYLNEKSTAYDVTIILEIFWWIALMYLVNQFISFFIWKKMLENSGVFVPKVLKDFVQIILFFIFLGCIKFFVFKGDVVGIFTASGVFALIIGYSAQSILGDIFAGIGMNIVRQFRSGDYVKIFGMRGIDISGKVIQINSRFVQLLTPENHYLTIPNSVILKLVVLNLSEPERVNFLNIRLPIFDGGSPDKIKSLIKAAALEAHLVLDEPKPSVSLIKIEKGEFLYSLDCYSKTTKEKLVTDEILSIIWYKFKKAGVKLNDKISNEPECLGAKELIPCLKKIDIFSMLRPQELKQLAQESKILCFGPPEQILQQDAVNHCLYIIYKGGVDIYLKIDDIKSKLISTLNEGEYFGEMSLLTGAPCQASVYANAECLIIEVNYQLMQRLFQNRPELIEKISEVMIKRKIETQEFKEVNKSTKSNEQLVSNLLSHIQAFFL